MKHYLLLGAGFSHNWGGWLASEAFEYLLGDPAVIDNPGLRKLLWEWQPKGGFELALDALQHGKTESDKHNEKALLAAIERMFQAMNSAFKFTSLEFERETWKSDLVTRFLVRFDAIFSLNQDLLLEFTYRGTADRLVDRSNPKTQRSWEMPGMQMRAPADADAIYPAEAALWEPSGSLTVPDDGQPIFKLHGSSNWRTSDGNNVMILGGGKAAAIERFPVLQWYSREFEDRVSRPDARLMVIGYGFRDDHITNILVRAIGKGLRIFVIDPKGAYAGDSGNPIPKDAAGYSPTNIQQLFADALIGASQRRLSAIFGTDQVERHKVERFFV